MAERTVVTLGETLAALVEGKKYATLRDILVTMNAVDVAGIFEEMPVRSCPCSFGCCPRSWRRRPSWRWSPRPRNCSFGAFPTMN